MNFAIGDVDQVRRQVEDTWEKWCKEHPCHVCGGKGKVQGIYSMEIRVCPLCHGSGRPVPVRQR